MYVPTHFAMPTDDAFAVMDANPFAVLVSGPASDLSVSHLPLVRQGKGLLGHLAAANPHVERLEGVATAIFRGPHAYVSPRWYRSRSNVPTWNYEAVTVRGEISRVTGSKAREQAVDLLVDKQEQGLWQVDWSSDYHRRLLEHIVVFTMSMDQVIGKRKMSQNKLSEDREGVVRGLEGIGESYASMVADRIRELE